MGLVVKLLLILRGMDMQVKLKSPSSERAVTDFQVVVVAAKSTSDASIAKPFPPDPNSQQSTISTVEREIREAGGDARAIVVDARHFESVQRMVAEAIKVGVRSFSCEPS